MKKVENYLTLKSYSNAYVDKLMKLSLPFSNAMNSDESSDEDTDDFFNRILKDLSINEEISKEKLLQWMFAWPYELSDDYFS